MEPTASQAHRSSEPAGDAGQPAPARTPEPGPDQDADRGAPRQVAPKKAPSDEPPPAKKAAAAKKTAAAVKAPAKTATTPAKATAPAKATTPPAKATASKKASPTKSAAKTAPAKKATASKAASKTLSRNPTRPVTAEVSLPERVTAPQIAAAEPWWARLPTSPAEVPGWLAQVAVERLGDSADRYVRWLRDTYPHATPDGLARAAIERFKGRPWYIALAGPAGLGALVSTQAELVLHIAAAYGHDPRDAQRVPELVALIAPRDLAASAVGRLIPCAGLVLGLVADRAALDDAARRAIARYRTGSV